MAKRNMKDAVSVPVLKVPQWVDTWDDIKFNDAAFQSEPKDYFFLFSLPASTLKGLSGVYRRTARKGQPRAKDQNVQRGHEQERSDTIAEFVKYGYPWCEMGEGKRRADEENLLRKPGWLPTAIIVNILEDKDVRNGTRIVSKDVIRVHDGADGTRLQLPESYTESDWTPASIFPLEVIDGQHRLWAFEGFDPGPDFHLPVVAFHGLDRSWQAYLFWSVNITPKRINRSLAFDLYPLLRKEDWLDKFVGHSIYRETRCQELVEALWSHPLSPWADRINMLGEKPSQLGTSNPQVTQTAWIRSLMASFVKEWGAADSARIGGLFGVSRGSGDLNLPYNRAMQAAFLLFAASRLRIEVGKSKLTWATSLRKLASAASNEEGDAAFYGRYALLATDQGIRGWLQVTNDLCFHSASELNLEEWTWEDVYSRPRAKSLAATDEGAVTVALESMEGTEAGEFLKELARFLAAFDWRTSSTPDLTPTERTEKAAFRGSGGYRELRRQLLKHLSEGKGRVAKAASKISQQLGF